VCVLFYQKTANLSSFYQILNLRNLLYFIAPYLNILTITRQENNRIGKADFSL